MSKILIFYLLVYGGMHTYFYLKLARALPRLGWKHIPLTALTMFLFLGLILVRMLEPVAPFALTRAIALVVYCWMAILFWYVCLFLCWDVWNLSVWGAGFIRPRLRRWLFPRRATFLVCTVVVALVAGWALIEATLLRVKEIRVETPHLEPGAQPIRIAQITDIHLGLIVRRRRLARIVDLIDEQAPDVIVSTGDLVDGSADHVMELAPLLASLDAPLGKYAVTGNHEFYTGIKQAEAFHQRAGFILLRGRSTLVDGRLWIGGVDDPAGLRRSGGDVHLNEGEALPGKHRWVASVLLKHRPLVDPRSVGRFDLQLSGHVHGGQIFPFVLFVAMTDSLLPGSHTFDGSTVYVSRGAGTWGPPMRFLAPPAITVIDLAPAG